MKQAHSASPEPDCGQSRTACGKRVAPVTQSPAAPEGGGLPYTQAKGLQGPDMCHRQRLRGRRELKTTSCVPSRKKASRHAVTTDGVALPWFLF